MTFRCPNVQYYFERIPLSQNIEYRVIISSFISMVSKAVIKSLYEGDKLSSKVMMICLFITSTSKQTNWSTSFLTLLMWSNKSSFFCLWKLVMNEDNIGQTPRLMNVAKDLLCLCWSFATFDVRKVITYEVECDDRHCLFDKPFVFYFFHFEINVRRSSFFIFVHNTPKIYESQSHLQFELPNIENFQMMLSYAQRMTIYSSIIQMSSF